MSIENMPRRVENVTVLSDEQILDPHFEQARFEQVFFCGCGQDFVISFACEEEAEAFAAAQCPACTALAPTFPSDVLDPAVAPVDLPAGVTSLQTRREQSAEAARVRLAISAA